MKVFVGLSGGVDSAVSAALLQKAGHDVTGVFIRIALDGYPCSAGEDKIEAQRVAAHLGIKFKAIDLSKEYKEEVFTYTIDEFKKGRTPNPDTLCNQKIKFGAFFDWCIAQGADMVATGHYAQAKSGKLYKGVDDTKDQSYFLWMVPKAALEKTLFPIGHLQKSKVRELAAEFNLPNAKRHDSQGLCFLGDISIDDMLTRELHLAPGNVLDEGGAIVGTHKGAVLYTPGQRHGFELHAQTPETEPHFVIGKDIAANTITVSTSRFPKGSTQTTVQLTNINWITRPSASEKYKARYRYRQTLISAAALSTSEILLKEPNYIPYGQSLVVYKGEECLGGGSVDSAALS
ncbi:MAG TPA: tRNA 2-thiouridine(34) synthase MnmA [Candidatus Paceibacterota bacterium]|nr:tRNA 2-thiouridine(34) synthase MnmA [Candidatus Paceibacterota bacterium]